MVAIRRRIALYFFCAVIALAPLPFGSVDGLVISFWAMFLGSSAVLAVPSEPRKYQALFLILGSIVALAWGLVLHEQTSARPWLAGDLVDPIWRQASRLLEVPLPQYVSVVRNQPYFAAGGQIVVFLSLLCGFLLGTDLVFARIILRIVAWSGALYGMYAVASFAWDPSLILWRNKIAYSTVLTGTFVNRNTAAIYFGVCAILWLLLLTKRVFGPTLRIPPEISISTLLRGGPPRPALISLAAFILLTSAVFMTGSRAGSTLFLMITVGFCFFSLRRKNSSRAAMIGLIACLALMTAALLVVVGGGVGARFSSDSLANEYRFPVYNAVVQLILDHPWLGTGLGTFAWIFPSYRPGEISTWGVWDKAHSTPLEIAAEQGVPFAIIIVGCILLIAYALICGTRARKERRIYPAAGLMFLLLSAAHSTIDFSLQIPGLAIVIFAVTGVGLAQSAPTRRVTPRSG